MIIIVQTSAHNIGAVGFEAMYAVIVMTLQQQCIKEIHVLD